MRPPCNRRLVANPELARRHLLLPAVINLLAVLRRLKADRAAPLLADPAVLLLALPVQAAPHRA